MNFLLVIFKNKTLKCLYPQRLNVRNFLEITQLSNYLCQGKQREQISTKECSEGIYFNLKN